MKNHILASAFVLTTLGLSGCSGDSPTSLFSGLSTGSVTPAAEAAPVPAQPKFSQACVSLATQIQTLRGDGSIDRLEKVAAGKGENVQVKRTAIGKQAELNKANADFQAKCGPAVPKTVAAAAATETPAVAETAKKMVKAAAAKPATPPQAKDVAAAAVAQAVPKAQ